MTNELKRLLKAKRRIEKLGLNGTLWHIEILLKIDLYEKGFISQVDLCEDLKEVYAELV